MKLDVRGVFAVFIGGLAGSGARLVITAASAGWSASGWPVGTLVINIVGSLALGWLVGVGSTSMPDWLHSGLSVGFLGSFTTLSAVSLDLVLPAMLGDPVGFISMAFYSLATLLGGVGAAVVGLRLGQRRSGVAS
jgi:CrcB protein